MSLYLFERLNIIEKNAQYFAWFIPSALFMALYPKINIKLSKCCKNR